MRINIYSQELTKEVKVISKKADDTGITYHGIRLYLHSHELLHYKEQTCSVCNGHSDINLARNCTHCNNTGKVLDDDRSAITFWIPHAESFTPADLARVFRKMASEVERICDLVEFNE